MTTIAEQARGQMFRRHVKPQLFVFRHEQTIRLHTFFVRKPIHVHFLDKDLRVTSERIVEPFRTCTGKGAYALETAVGTLRLKRGSRCTLQPAINH